MCLALVCDRDVTQTESEMIMKRLEYHFVRVTAPAPKRLLIESHSDGTHHINDLCPNADERLDEEGHVSDRADTTVSGYGTERITN